MGYFCDIEAKVKECSKCKVVLPFDDFSPSKNHKGGRWPVCRSCRSRGKAGYRPRIRGRQRLEVFCDIVSKVKECSTCRAVLPFDSFYVLPSGRGGVGSQCKKCFSEYNKSVSSRRKLKRHNLLFLYGLTLDQYEKMLAEQGGMCLICEQVMSKPHVDHCHDTGNVRGLLCQGCNLGIGQLKDNTGNMLRAIDYLNHHKGND